MLTRLYFSLMPPTKSFWQLTYSTLPFFIKGQLYSNIFYTPYTQLKPLSRQLLSHMKYLQRRDKVSHHDLSSLVQRTVATYVQTYNEQHPEAPDCGYSKDFFCSPNPFGGVVSYLVFCKNSTRFVPILYIDDEIDLAPTVGAALWNLTNQKEAELDGYAIQTNGSRWQMAKVTRGMQLEKTPAFQPKNDFNRAYEDEEFVSMTMGLIEEGLQVERIQRKALRTAYQYIDEKKDHFELPEGIEKPKEPWVKRLLNKYMK